MVVWHVIISVMALGVGLMGHMFAPDGILGLDWVIWCIIGTSGALSISAYILASGLQKRRNAAKAAGLTLCSKCEYPLDLSSGLATCPECGSFQGPGA